MVLVVAPEAADRTVELARARGVAAWVVGEVVEADGPGAARYEEAG
jgi:phosphoribosylaminoimidazole (AIR) synthetase